MNKRVLATTFAKYFEEQMLLREGLIASYGASSLKAVLFSNFEEFITRFESIPLFQTNKPCKFGVPDTVTIHVKNPELFKKHQKKLETILNQQGYLQITHERVDQHTDMYQFEPKYPITISKDRLKPFRIFHITEEKRLQKILKNGLNPKGSRTNFKHQGNRIYLFATVNPSLEVPILCKQLSKRLVKQKDNTIEPELRSMVVLEINLQGIKEEELYVDESFDYKPNSFAVFTLYSIRPEYIKICDKL